MQQAVIEVERVMYKISHIRPIGPDGQLGDEGRRLKAKVSQLRRKTEIVNKTLNFTADLYIRQHLIA